jgi:hypothetical protein
MKTRRRPSASAVATVPPQAEVPMGDAMPWSVKPPDKTRSREQAAVPAIRVEASMEIIRVFFIALIGILLRKELRKSSA